MKYLGTTLMLLAASATYVVSLPAQYERDVVIRTAYDPGMKYPDKVSIHSSNHLFIIEVVVRSAPDYEMNLVPRQGKGKGKGKGKAAGKGKVRPACCIILFS
jgi:hypothetical protein